MKRLTRWLAAGAGLGGVSYGTYAAPAWLRYGRPRKAGGEAADALLDKFMPSYDLCKRHPLALVTPADVTVAAAKQIQLEDSRIIRAIFKVVRSSCAVIAAAADRQWRLEGDDIIPVARAQLTHAIARSAMFCRRDRAVMAASRFSAWFHSARWWWVAAHDGGKARGLSCSNRWAGTARGSSRASRAD